MKNSIRKRTFCFISLSMILIILVFSVFFFHYLLSTMRQRLKTDQTRTTASMAESMSNLILNIKQNAYFLCSNGSLAQALVNKMEYPSYIQQEMVKRAFSVNTGSLSTPLMQNANAFLLLDSQFPFSYTFRGNFTYPLTKQRLYSVMDVQDEEWYIKTINRMSHIYAFWDEESPQNAFFSHQLRSTQIADPFYNDNVGVVLYTVPKSVLTKILENARITEGSVALFKFEDDIFISTDSSLFPREGDAGTVQALKSLPVSGQVVEITIQGKKYMASSVSFQRDWEAVLLMPFSDIWRYVSTPLPATIAILLLFLFLALFLSLLLSRQLVEPVIRLSNTMSQVQYNRSLPLPVPNPASHDEIEVLYSSYNRMLEWIQRLMEEAVEEGEKLRSAQLQSMQAQINPHFIYNTLDSISCSALLEGNDDIVTMVASLISILKYSINFSRTTVPLREEIDYLRHYIQIQELRYKGGFRFICDVPEKYYSVKVSQIILQPLVENAMFHAQSKEDILEIRLFCEEDGGGASDPCTGQRRHRRRPKAQPNAGQQWRGDYGQRRHRH